MKKIINTLLSHRLRAVLRKEFAQMRRDRRLAMSLIVFPTIQLLLFTLVLNATVSNLKLGIIDDSRTPESRGLTSTLTESKSFALAGYYYSVDKLGDAISHGDVDAGVIIPFTYAKDLQRGRPVTVQLLLNAMNANTAAIAEGYASGVIQTYNTGLTNEGLHAKFTQVTVSDVSHRGVARLTGAYLYNPGLVASWFVVTGVFGLLLVMNGAMVAATSMVK
jgi:ABC-2 type transport system permease protein